MKETELITFELVGQKEQYIIWVSLAAKKKKIYKQLSHATAVLTFMWIVALFPQGLTKTAVFHLNLQMEEINSPAQKEPMSQNGKAQNQKREENSIQIGNYFVMKQRQRSLKRRCQVF